MSKGFTIQAAYTVSKEIDDMFPSVNGFPGESFSGAPPQNFYNLRGARAGLLGYSADPGDQLHLRAAVRTRQTLR
jgi:hypothetical protein